MVIDSHLHLDDERFASDLEMVLARAREARVEHMVTVGTDIESCESAIALAQRHRGFISATVGIHPHDADEATEPALATLGELAREPGVVGVGETGLDYHYQNASRDAQKRLFELHIRLAADVNLPVVIHCREAFGDCMAILRRSAGSGLRGVVHCFSGSADTAQELLKLGFHISFAGPITFPNARRVRQVARLVPLEKVLVETDSPYLAPQAERGRHNEPAFLRYVASALAEAMGRDEHTVRRATRANAIRLFGLPRQKGRV